jgi:hypothetical protein
MKHHVHYPPTIPASIEPGYVLVHNNVRPAERQGAHGFRFWLQPLSNDVTRCDCGWAPELSEHYHLVARDPLRDIRAVE